MKRILLITMLMVCAQAKAQTTLTLMEYNVENAFDTTHDEGKNDLEFCTDGERKWTRKRMYRKLNNIAKAIVAADEHQPVDLVALCEVENDSVMQYLTRRTPLASLNYSYIITNSADQRGIDVALLYSPLTFHPVNIQHIRPQQREHPTRDILHVAGTIAGGDTIDVFVAHLPSKRGGTQAQKLSMSVAQLLKDNIDSVAKVRQKTNIIVAGDLNSTPHSPQLKLLTSSILSSHTNTLSPGSYKYQGEWSTIDHTLSHTQSLTHIDTKVLTTPFLLEKDPTNGGMKPFRTYLGPIYHGGPSDHLPVVTKWEVK